MSGYAFMFGTCAACRQVFGFHPHKVPSIRLGGMREPICEPCITEANAKRKAAGLPLLPVLAGAYEPLSEEEL